MKKILLLLMLCFSFLAEAQESFTIKYGHVFADDGSLKYDNPVNVTMVFNYLETTDVLFINSSGNKTIFHITKYVEDGKTTGGDEYKFYEAIDSNINVECYFQVFTENMAVRIIYKDVNKALTFIPAKK